MSESCLWMVRHAPSEHNLAKQKWKKKKNVPHYKEAPDYAQLKYDHTLVDPPLLPHSPDDFKAAREALDLSRTALVLCSPMRRCLQTCALLLHGHEGAVRVVVEPLLSSRLNSAWSVGSSVREMQAEFGQFDFGAFAGMEDTWMMKLLERTRKIDSKDTEQNAHRGSQFMLETLAKGKGEDYEEFRRRVIDLKARLRHLLHLHAQSHPHTHHRPNVLIVSHSCVLNFLIAQEFTENGKVKTKENFQHCVPKRFEAAQLLPTAEEESLKAKL